VYVGSWGAGVLLAILVMQRHGKALCPPAGPPPHEFAQ